MSFKRNKGAPGMGRTNSQGGSLDWLRWAADLLIGLHIERKRRGCRYIFYF
ncbi:hypothetical protein HanXRQr2_Chr05g0206421 [Helianthus annuus]|uniref:Uncharacterized protein n=1 Tax=Helianthus annuus TaxID=4232 RepID=A0A9K3NLX2_HELAN|nr:hypothetical protein HanXRQr2_Chr05g0206421 [Helianthus annuus]KAJ0576278.1 hypothetical protein HanIR_Chr05g0222541 [Helianthus annuus]